MQWVSVESSLQKSGWGIKLMLPDEDIFTHSHMA
jgi:hypothetical protein